MPTINNRQQYHAAIAAVCPIDGIDSNGKIFFAKEASAAQIAAANQVAATYADAPRQMLSMERLLGSLTDIEYQALITAAQTNVALHRALYQDRKLDLALPAVKPMIQVLVNAGVLTAARAQAVFVAPPAPPVPVIVPLPVGEPIG